MLSVIAAAIPPRVINVFSSSFSTFWGGPWLGAVSDSAGTGGGDCDASGATEDDG